jgi:uncharacterized protein YlxW (UPF0749 family)
VTDQSSRQRLIRAEIRFVTITGIIVTIVAILVGSQLYGRYLANRDLAGRDAALIQLRAEAQKLKTHADDLSAQVTDLKTKLDKTQAALDAIMPSANTYNISPNQTLIVGDGHLTVGLVGSPGNEGITLDVNGKQQVLTAGQVISVAPDPATNCQVSVQSFTMFTAVLSAACSGGKPH